MAQMVAKLKLRYAVITSVTRDDLLDGGAEAFAGTVLEIRKLSPGTIVELLVPDFAGSRESLAQVMASGPDVLNHNLETVNRLYPTARPGASYQRSLELLRQARDIQPQITTKSGLMLGLGETRDELLGVMKDLMEVGCTVLTLGQYLSPSQEHLPVARFYSPEEFNELKELGMTLGLRQVVAGPLVRSSYRAEEASILPA